MKPAPAPIVRDEIRAPMKASDAARQAPSYVFVVPPSRSLSLERLRTLDTRADWRELGHGEFSWCLQTYLELRDRGWPVELANEPQPDRLNLVHTAHLSYLKPAPDAFIVSIQADYPAVPWTSVNIVQNRRQEDGRRSFWIPHWPQPGLVARDPSRSGVTCVAYAGVPCWLAQGRNRWQKALESLELEFRILGPTNWNDYSSIDVLVAVRSFDRSAYDGKPPSKLFNAWHAGIPLVAGYDSAFEQLGRPGVDYLRVAGLDEAIEAVTRLRNDADLYRSIVEAGAARGKAYTRARIAEAWQRLLEGPVSAQFVTWRERGFPSRIRTRMRARVWWLDRQFRRIAKRTLQNASARAGLPVHRLRAKN